MPGPKNAEETDWQAVLARAVAYLCLQQTEGKSTVLEKAEFLMAFGLPRADAARLLGTSEDSLRVLAQRAEEGQRKGHKEIGLVSHGGG